ncbi:zinc finger SWIM domain-containing protein 7-like [Toxorhynchites rutilus septentrionalis]|uniref:zinc finger SWIM domain-containing protein 7-like n=1 Tax=Toxorhynchites rutilus septentrionalis TaxID=329112 RepID=UPI002479226B|nr:zinc finger SWIM domain-containing protein 7-like [Toxorhynchites rutilus septentrionalis]
MSSEAYLFYDCVDSLLARISRSVSNCSNSDSKELSKDHLLELESLFGQALLERALTLVHGKTPIKLYRTPNGIGRLYEIPGSKVAVTYKVFPAINFCTCESFRYWVLQQRHQPTCKHILATSLAKLLGKVAEEVLEDKYFFKLKSELIKERMKTISHPVQGTSNQPRVLSP